MNIKDLTPKEYLIILKKRVSELNSEKAKLLKQLNSIDENINAYQLSIDGINENNPLDKKVISGFKSSKTGELYKYISIDLFEYVIDRCKSKKSKGQPLSQYMSNVVKEYLGINQDYEVLKKDLDDYKELFESYKDEYVTKTFLFKADVNDYNALSKIAKECECSTRVLISNWIYHHSTGL